jgi:hypothetical protein
VIGAPEWVSGALEWVIGALEWVQTGYMGNEQSDDIGNSPRVRAAGPK